MPGGDGWPKLAGMHRSCYLPLLAAVFLSACGTSDPASVNVTVTPLASAQELCVSSTCGEAIAIADIPDAENILFSDDGRLFVSGGENVYEITKNADGTYTPTVISDATCNFTGLTIQNGVLYASCSGGSFWAGRIAPTIVLTNIFTFDGMCIPNGTAAGPDGRIYVVDEPLTCTPGDPKIVALTLDPNDPLKVISQDVSIQGSPEGLLFVGGDNVLKFPNGLARDGNTMYGTDGGSVFSVSIGNSGEAGVVTPLFFEPTAHDDLGVVDGGLLVADFFKGRIVLLSREGDLLQETLPGTFAEPSSVRLARPPMFDRGDILVTDKGVIGENNAPIDKLYVFRRRAI